MSVKLINAAQAVIERWDSSQWNWGEPTAALIHELRQAVDAARRQGQEEAKAASVEGWKLVPTYPTVEMLAAYCRQMSTGSQVPGEHNEAERYQVAAYIAMIAAAPSPAEMIADPPQPQQEA